MTIPMAQVDYWDWILLWACGGWNFFVFYEGTTR